MKTQILKIITLFILAMPIFIMGQDLSAFNDVLAEQQQVVTDTAVTVLNYVYLIGGIAAIIGLATTMFAGRDGDDKVKSFGKWMLMIGLFLVGIAIVTQLFGISR